MPVEEARSLTEGRGGAEEESLLTAKPTTFVLHQRGNVVVSHARTDFLEQAVENLVLHRRRLADEILLLLALDRLEAIDEFDRIHEGGLAGEFALNARDESVRHGAGANPADGAVAAMLEFLGDELRLVFVRIDDAGKCRRKDDLSDTSVALIGAIDLATPAARAHVDHRHQIARRKDDAARIAVAQGRIREPTDIAAEPVVVVLHHQRIDLALRHGFAHRAPATFELAGRNRIEEPFVHYLHPAEADPVS